MIWLNTDRCWRTPPIASAASALRDGLGRAAGRAVDRARHRRRVAVGAHDERLEHAGADRRRRAGWRSARRATSAGEAHSVPGPGVAHVVDEADDPHRAAGRSEREGVALLHALVLEHAVGVGLADGGRRREPRRGARSYPNSATSTRSRGPLPGTRAPSWVTPIPPTSLTPGYGLDLRADLGADPAAQERLLGRRREDDQVGALRPDRARRALDQPVEQAAEQHQQHRDEREQHRRGREATRPPPHLPQREPHEPSPRRRAPRPARCAAPAAPRTTSWPTPSSRIPSAPAHDRGDVELQRDRTDPMERHRQVEQRADRDAQTRPRRAPARAGAHDSVLERAPIARSSVSVRAFCSVTIRKNSPMTSGTTRP